MPELSNPVVIIAAASLLVTIIAVGAGSLYRLARIISKVEEVGERVNRLEARIDRLEDRIDQVEQEMRAEMRALREEIRSDMRALRDEMRADMREFREEMRAEMQAFREDTQRNHEQLLAALAGHTHDEAGQAMFRSPL